MTERQVLESVRFSAVLLPDQLNEQNIYNLFKNLKEEYKNRIELEYCVLHNSFTVFVKSFDDSVPLMTIVDYIPIELNVKMKEKTIEYKNERQKK